jgi:hypothetical protein
MTSVNWKRQEISARMGRFGGDTMQQPSRFLSEIPRDLLNEWDLRSRYG